MAAHKPILIIGGGIAGLYTRALVASRGRDVVLVERSMLGDGQTVASQGILHRGVKYALSRKAAHAADALERSLKAWDEHFKGQGCVDLRHLPLAATRMHLWTRPGHVSSIMGSLTGMAASLAMKSGVRRLPRAEFPAALAPSPEGVNAWEVEERCVDVRALLTALRDVEAGPIVLGGDAGVAALAARFDPAAVVLAAGGGNESLLAGLGVDAASLCQRRPLHMVVMRGAPFDFNGHCLQELSDKPRLTITTSRSGTRTGENRVWYIGGDIAERGVSLDEASQVRATIAELEACMGWADLRGGTWSTLRIDRAEGRSEDGSRPDGPVCRRIDAAGLEAPVWAAWPTKLALAPALAAGVVAAIEEAGVSATKRTLASANRDVPVASYPWDTPATMPGAAR